MHRSVDQIGKAAAGQGITPSGRVSSAVQQLVWTQEGGGGLLFYDVTSYSWWSLGNLCILTEPTVVLFLPGHFTEALPALDRSQANEGSEEVKIDL